MQAELRAGRTPHLGTGVSHAVELARQAKDRVQYLSGVKLTVSAEPVTAPRLGAIRLIGAEPLPSYGSQASGLLAYGCLQPSFPDDMHLYHDVHAVVQPGARGGGGSLPSDALLLTSLRQTWPIMLLNVSVGDRADIVKRACGCALHELGWTTRLHNVRSFEKLRLGGGFATEVGLVRILEELLPARFGGGPTDYQLFESDDEVASGHVQLRLLVHPAVGRLDHHAVAMTFLAAVRESGAGVEPLAQQPDWLVVNRRPPFTTAGGKVYHLHRAAWPVRPRP